MVSPGRHGVQKEDSDRRLGCHLHGWGNSDREETSAVSILGMHAWGQELTDLAGTLGPWTLMRDSFCERCAGRLCPWLVGVKKLGG